MNQHADAPQLPPIADLERRQDEVLEQLDQLDASILALLEEFNSRLADENGSRFREKPDQPEQ